MKTVHKKPQDWTAQDIAAFWDWQSKNANRQQQYFTAVMAPAIVQFIKMKGLLKGDVLDYGCGAGHLLEQMVKQTGVNFYGLDFSADSIDETKKRTLNSSHLKELVLVDKLPTHFRDEQFDSITLIETIEHLQDEVLHETMQELCRILKRSGKLFITTPFNEDLDSNLNFCPFCKSEFHHMQHMQSFNVESLTALATKYEFTVELCMSMDIERLKIGPVKYAIRQTLKKLATAAGLKDAANKKIPNLLALFIKP
ncbi:MAG: class I SAM-dependent methyltransferase [Ferruginibacter sp.]|nr:class I SAM-dependent methyltransferase [Chitinophagaceae bacterium]